MPVRDDLKTYNRRLLDYVQQGGNLIVLYNTQEFVPNTYAPYPGAAAGSRRGSVGRGLTGRRPRAVASGVHHAEPDHDGRLRRLGEQRGSKFFTEWDAAYTPMIATHDQSQAPQQGGWLTAVYGKGTTRTSPTPSIVSCPTASRAPTACSRIFCPSEQKAGAISRAGPQPAPELSSSPLTRTYYRKLSIIT